ncbi:MAG TPA: bifunctional 4-hydroxy-2-oxoglutarate aldolase/2-dehydro-3-deoxy-phosphogluconate aldolase [Acidimicrobiia bacterium]|nr:bifunctional 4-hydroxy-2-oxoglutarate aldolase/2-dehydro-3-deoxy-phosphogluconate aldolase [Acidimicrobiia bacterium]
MNGAHLPAGLSMTPVIAILRGCPHRYAVAIAGAVVGAGVTVIEVTLDSERALDQIAAIQAEFPDAEVGVGTVRRVEELAPAIEAGATFVVSPIVDPEVIRSAVEQGVAVIPGAATPTEIEMAVRHGATAVKVFPIAQLGGPGYIRAIGSPLGFPQLIPTGGVHLGSIEDYLSAGAVAVGLGGALFPSKALREGDTATVERLAKEIVEAQR